MFKLFNLVNNKHAPSNTVFKRIHAIHPLNYECLQMTEMDAKSRIDILRKQLADHNHAYYLLDNPTISDFDFDQLLEELIVLEKLHPELFDVNSPSQRVGGSVNKSFETVKHNVLCFLWGIHIPKMI